MANAGGLQDVGRVLIRPIPPMTRAIGEAIAASTEALEIRAPKAFKVDDAGAPLPVPSTVKQAGLLLANRLMSRRNSRTGWWGCPIWGRP